RESAVRVRQSQEVQLVQSARNHGATQRRPARRSEEGATHAGDGFNGRSAQQERLSESCRYYEWRSTVGGKGPRRQCANVWCWPVLLGDLWQAVRKGTVD